MNNNRSKSEKSPMLRALIAGAIGVAAALALLFAYALCVERLLLKPGREALIGRAILFLAALLAAYLACAKGGGGKLPRAGASAAVLVVFVLFAGVLTESSSVINMSLLWNVLCIICGAVAGALLTVRRKKRRRRRSFDIT